MAEPEWITLSRKRIGEDGDLCFPLAPTQNAVGGQRGYAIRQNFVTVQDGIDAQREGRFHWPDFSRGIGDGRGALPNASNYMTGFFPSIGSLRLGPDADSWTLAGVSAINDIIHFKNDTTDGLYLATDDGVWFVDLSGASPAAPRKVGRFYPSLGIPAPTGNIKSLEIWREQLFCALGANTRMVLLSVTETNGEGLWLNERNAVRADVLGLSRSTGQQEPTLVRGLGSRWSRFVIPRPTPDEGTIAGADAAVAPDTNPAPNIIAVGVTETQARVAWAEPKAGRPQGAYQVRYGPVGATGTLDTSATTWTTPFTVLNTIRNAAIPNLTAGTQYAVQVRGLWTDADDQRWSPIIHFNTNPADSDDERVDNRAPSSLAVTSLVGGVSVKWEAGDDQLGDFSSGKQPAIQQIVVRQMTATQVNDANNLAETADRMAGGTGTRYIEFFSGTAREGILNVPTDTLNNYGVAVATIDTSGVTRWSEVQLFRQLARFEEGAWSTDYDIGSPITYLFPFREGDYVGAENGLYTFDIRSNVVNQITDLRLQPSPDNRYITPFNDGVLFSSAYGLYRLLPASAQTTTGIEECELDRLHWGPPRCATTLGRYVYEARQYVQTGAILHHPVPQE